MIRKFMVAVAAFALFPVAASAQDGGSGEQAAPAPKPLEGKKLVVYIVSDETRQAGLGLFTARMAARAGAKVTVILAADGVRFGLKKGKQEQFIAVDETPRELLTTFMGFGGTVYVCKICVPAQGLEASDFIDGAQVITMKEIFGVLFEDNVKTLEF